MNAVNDFQLHELVAEEPQRPARIALRRCRAGQRNQLRLPRTVQLPRLAIDLLATLQRRFKPLLHAALAHPFHGGGSNPQNRRDIRVGASAILPILVCQQQDVRVLPAMRRRFPVHNPGQLRSLLRAQPHPVSLPAFRFHGLPPSARSARPSRHAPAPTQLRPAMADRSSQRTSGSLVVCIRRHTISGQQCKPRPQEWSARETRQINSDATLVVGAKQRIPIPDEKVWTQYCCFNGLSPGFRGPIGGICGRGDRVRGSDS